MESFNPVIHTFVIVTQLINQNVLMVITRLGFNIPVCIVLKFVVVHRRSAATPGIRSQVDIVVTAGFSQTVQLIVAVSIS
ncbi:hypothetical protein D3C86_1661080 [compost metagenome]